MCSRDRALQIDIYLLKLLTYWEGDLQRRPSEKWWQPIPLEVTLKKSPAVWLPLHRDQLGSNAR